MMPNLGGLCQRPEFTGGVLKWDQVAGKPWNTPEKSSPFLVYFDHLDVYFGDISVLESLGAHFKKSPHGNQTDEKKR